MSLARPSIAFDNSPNEAGFFDRERDRLIEEISTVSRPLLKSQVRADIQSFEGLMAHTNVLNRKLEEVHGVGKEFTTVADLWGQFNALIRAQQSVGGGDAGVPGTGGANFGQSTT